VRVDGATLNLDCSIASQTGRWLTSVSGTYSVYGCTYTLAAGEFSSPPACTCTAVFNGRNDNWCAFSALPSRTSVSLYTRFQDTVGDPASTTLICVGQGGGEGRSHLPTPDR
jgi:hypothetical protein